MPAEQVPRYPPAISSVHSSRTSLWDGRYRLGRPLGGGAEADVLEAFDTWNASSVVLKIFRSAGSRSGEPFLREIEFHSRLRHRNIVRVAGHGRHQLAEGGREGRDYLVMELMAGGDLRSIIKNGPSCPPTVAKWVADILEGLAHLHLRRIIHNDVKPGNILIGASSGNDTAGPAKLSDFGIATSGRRRARYPSAGTPHYLSPEEARGHPPTAASDIYATGLVALECLTGTKTYPGTPLETMVARTLREPRVPGTVPRRWARVLLDMTNPDPLKRPSARKAAGIILRLSEATGTDTYNPAPARRTHPLRLPRQAGHMEPPAGPIPL
jgi:eukaryotic-like serine/threonine-protein kinase